MRDKGMNEDRHKGTERTGFFCSVPLQLCACIVL